MMHIVYIFMQKYQLAFRRSCNDLLINAYYYQRSFTFICCLLSDDLPVASVAIETLDILSKLQSYKGINSYEKT